MAIVYTTTVEGDTLTVLASGFDESLAEVLEYGKGLIAACVEHRVRRVLCDETDLEYRLDTFDTFNAAEFIAANAPRVAKAAIVCRPTNIGDARFWETVAINRGLYVRVFTNTESARSWLSGNEPPQTA